MSVESDAPFKKLLGAEKVPKIDVGNAALKVQDRVFVTVLAKRFLKELLARLEFVRIKELFGLHLQALDVCIQTYFNRLPSSDSLRLTGGFLTCPRSSESI